MHADLATSAQRYIVKLIRILVHNEYAHFTASGLPSTNAVRSAFFSSESVSAILAARHGPQDHYGQRALIAASRWPHVWIKCSLVDGTQE